MQADLDTDPQVLNALRGVDDPEVGINIVDLGLVYCAFRRGNRVHVDLTLTSRACPLGESVLAAVEEALDAAFPGLVADVNLVWEPPWHPDFITESGQRELGRPIRRDFDVQFLRSH